MYFRKDCGLTTLRLGLRLGFQVAAIDAVVQESETELEGEAEEDQQAEDLMRRGEVFGLVERTSVHGTQQTQAFARGVV